jgi:Uma2 family endonuclease
MSANTKQKWTVEEYLAFEETSETKHEFYDGEIFAMAQISEAHNVIIMNVAASLHAQLRKNPSRVYPGDLRLRANKTGSHTYPDITVVCGEPHFTKLDAEIQLSAIDCPLLITDIYEKVSFEDNSSEE